MALSKRISIAISLLALALIAAQEPYQRPNADEYIKILESRERVERMQVDRVVSTLKIAPGQKIADLGAGSGLFTRPLAEKVGSAGVIFAIDIDPDLLNHIEKIARQHELSNIRTVLGSEDDPNLPEPVDLIFIADTLHHINNRLTYLTNLRRYLRASGRIAIIDFDKTWPQGHESMKFTLKDLNKWMKIAGFKRVEKHDFLNNQIFVVYEIEPKS